MLQDILTLAQEETLKIERQWLADLQITFSKLDATSEDHETLQKSIHQLDELFLLVIVGEFNSGKSSAINALLGQAMLKEGVTPTTAQVNILKYGETSQRQVQAPHLHVLLEPLDILRHINIVDTPGTNAIIQEHQAITEDFVPRSDLVLFVTSSDRPFTESERQFLNKIRDWGKKVIIILNKIDLIQTEDERQQVIAFVSDNTKTLLQFDPVIFPISARKAFQSKQGKPALWSESQFEALERYIRENLDEHRRILLKFLNPLGIGQKLLNKYLDIMVNRLTLLADDIEVLDDLDWQIKYYQEDMRRNFDYRLADLDNILYEMEKRGHDFFDDIFRLGRVTDLLNKSFVQREFENKVVADVPQVIQQKTNELIDWLVNADFKQWQAVTAYLEQHKIVYNDRMVGNVGENFRYDRERLIDSVERTAQHVVETYDQAGEAKKIAEQAQQAVIRAAGIQVGAIGLGATVMALATATAIDITGFLAASLVVIAGAFLIPARRRVARKELSDKLADLRRNLMRVLGQQFDKELRRSIDNLNEAIAPYDRFVRGQKDQLTETKEALTKAQEVQTQLRAQIEEFEHEPNKTT